MPRTTTKYDGALISPPIFITTSDGRGQKKLYPIFKDRQSDAQLLQCEDCGRFISLPGNRSLVKMEKHLRSLECSRAKKKQERWRLEEEIRAEANAALAASGLQYQPVKPVVSKHLKTPIIDAQSLLNATGTISFAIPLRTSSSPSKSPFETMLAPYPDLYVNQRMSQASPSSKNPSPHTPHLPPETHPSVTPISQARPHNVLGAPPIPPSNGKQRSGTTELSSDSEDDIAIPHLPAMESGSELSDEDRQSRMR